jgi:hypothetical protein
MKKNLLAVGGPKHGQYIHVNEKAPAGDIILIPVIVTSNCDAPIGLQVEREMLLPTEPTIKTEAYRVVQLAYKSVTRRFLTWDALRTDQEAFAMLADLLVGEWILAGGKSNAE